MILPDDAELLYIAEEGVSTFTHTFLMSLYSWKHLYLLLGKRIQMRTMRSITVTPNPAKSSMIIPLTSTTARNSKMQKTPNSVSSNPPSWINLKILWSKPKQRRKSKSKKCCWSRNSNRVCKISSIILNLGNKRFCSTISKKSSVRNKNGNLRKDRRKRDWGKRPKKQQINS